MQSVWTFFLYHISHVSIHAVRETLSYVSLDQTTSKNMKAPFGCFELESNSVPLSQQVSPLSFLCSVHLLLGCQVHALLCCFFRDTDDQSSPNWTSHRVVHHSWEVNVKTYIQYSMYVKSTESSNVNWRVM